MSINVVVQDGVVKSPALRYATDGKPEFRFTLVQTEHDWPLYLPCCAAGAAAERLASDLSEGDHIVLSSVKLCYRKRDGKSGPQSRMEIFVWQVDRLSESTGPVQADVPEGGSGFDATACPLEPVSVSEPKKARKPRYIGAVTALREP